MGDSLFKGGRKLYIIYVIRLKNVQMFVFIFSFKNLQISERTNLRNIYSVFILFLMSGTEIHPCYGPSSGSDERATSC